MNKSDTDINGQASCISEQGGLLYNETGRWKIPQLAAPWVTWKTGMSSFLTYCYLWGMHVIVVWMMGMATIDCPEEASESWEKGLDELNVKYSDSVAMWKSRGGNPRMLRILWFKAVLHPRGKSRLFILPHPSLKLLSLRPCVSLTDITAWN